MVSAPAAEWLHWLHPQRLQYELFCDANPFMSSVGGLADRVRENRSPAAAGNPFVALQENMSRQIVAVLDAWRDFVETSAERTFLSIYGSPLLQAAVGIDPADTRPLRKAAKTPLHQELVQARIAELKSRIKVGGTREGAVRALLYAGLGRTAVDERGFEAIRRIRLQPGMKRPSLAEFKAMVRDQYFMLLIEPEAAVAAIPELLPADGDVRRKTLAAIRQVLSAAGEISGEVAERLQRIERLLGVEEERAPVAVLVEKR